MNLAGARRQPELCRHWASARSRQPEMSVSVAPRSCRVSATSELFEVISCSFLRRCWGAGDRRACRAPPLRNRCERRERRYNGCFGRRIVEGEDRTNILFFEACRDNSLSRDLQRAMGTCSLAPLRSRLWHHKLLDSAWKRCARTVHGRAGQAFVILNSNDEVRTS